MRSNSKRIYRKRKWLCEETIMKLAVRSLDRLRADLENLEERVVSSVNNGVMLCGANKLKREGISEILARCEVYFKMNGEVICIVCGM